MSVLSSARVTHGHCIRVYTYFACLVDLSSLCMWLLAHATLKDIDIAHMHVYYFQLETWYASVLFGFLVNPMNPCSRVASHGKNS